MWDGPTFYIAGDSTVTDQSASYPYLPWNSYAAWGQMLSFFVGSEAAISNHAHSGLTTESFRSEGHYRILLDRVKKDDIVLFQFGHNDQKLMELKHDEGYHDRLLTYIREIREIGATPVIVSPLARNSWKKDGDLTRYNDLLKDYAKECELVTEKLDACFIDLHQRSMDLILTMGRDKAKSLFFPGDYTHTNDYGAFLFASMIFDGLKKLGIVSAKRVDTLWQPLEETFDLVIPDEYKNRKNPDGAELFENLERPEDFLTRVEAMDFIIKTCKFFPTNVYNDYFIDVIGHETYAGTVECAYQNGMIGEDMISDGMFYPGRFITRKEFKEALINGYSARMTIDNTVLDKLDLGPDLNSCIKRKEAADICRGLSV
ncbi:MAG: rhamnogalacturonan acetylesterase [Bacteroidaceae bacterium]|nr:rhamnogalacturonan acetylesterase [Bacteroidaceae bacterium]